MNRKPTQVQGEGCSKWHDPAAAGRRMASHENSDNNFTTNQENVDGELKFMRRPKDAMFEVAKSKLAYLLSKETCMQMEARLSGIVSDMHTPNHPTYAEMICNAIDALKEEGGSNEASISAYIKSQYHDLPWAHESLLSHHLGRLSSRGEIVPIPNGCYMLQKSNINPKNKQQRQKEQQKSMVLHGNEEYHNAQEILTMKQFSTFIDEKIPMSLPPLEAQPKPIMRRGRPPKPKEEENVKGSQSNSEANIKVEIGVEKEEEKVKEAKKRRGRLPKKDKIGAKKQKKEDGEMEKQSSLRGKQGSQLEINQEDVGVEKKVFYGPKKRRGRPPKAKLEIEPAADADN